jgi:hypothetical protein
MIYIGVWSGSYMSHLTTIKNVCLTFKYIVICTVSHLLCAIIPDIFKRTVSAYTFSVPHFLRHLLLATTKLKVRKEIIQSIIYFLLDTRHPYFKSKSRCPVPSKEKTQVTISYIHHSTTLHYQLFLTNHTHFMYPLPRFHFSVAARSLNPQHHP